MKTKIEQTAFFSILITLTAQVSINLFTNNFKISIAVICLSVCALLSENFPLIPVTFMSTIGVFTLRMLIFWVRFDKFASYKAFMPEMCFYLCYGLLLYLYTRYRKTPSVERTDDTLFGPDFLAGHGSALIALICIDYFANLSELLVRIHIRTFTVRTQIGILLIALVRSLIIWVLILVFEQYRLLLLKREQEERYRRLVLLISKLNGEVVWMKKNTSLIEETMNTSYRLFEDLKKNGADPKLAASALSTAKDIHEIKKEYLLIMRGISEALDEEFQNDGMYLEELFTILRNSLVSYAKEHDIELNLEYECTHNFYTDKHYALLSIFRNLFINSMEAAKTSAVHIKVTQIVQNNSYLFEVTDDGPGIPEEYRDEIFKTGFSTKINYTTGEVSRGLGLNLVQDLVQNELGGTISVASKPGCTTFSICLPKNLIEVNKK